MYVLILLGAVVAALSQPAMAQDLQARLAAADPEAGATVFRRCLACHTVEEGKPHRVGPNLWGVIDRPVASAEGFKRYSPALKALGGTWDLERLDAYIEKPKVVVPKGTMAFPGLADAKARADLIAFLNQNSPEPKDLTAPAGQ